MISKGIKLQKQFQDDEFIIDSVLGSIRITQHADFTKNTLHWRLDVRLEDGGDIYYMLTEEKDPHTINGMIDDLRKLVKGIRGNNNSSSRCI